MVTISDDGVMFAKNSDRDANEAQILEWIPGRRHEPESRLRCTWIEIPEVEVTCAVLLSRPWWMWGAEMGANEHGVVIGNEAVFTNQPQGEPALLGMDLVRLALERAPTAREAVSVVVELLERHGQGGPCSHERPGFRYHNSFLVADPFGAIVLETAGRNWATEEVKAGARSISNGLTIAAFAASYSDRLRERVTGCRLRRARTEAAARSARGPLDLMAALRDHGPGGQPRWSIVNGTLNAPCVHAGGLLASSQTTASLVSDLRPGGLHWATATAAPCTSLFKPVRVDEPIDLGPKPTNRMDDSTIWWRHERLHRAAMRDPSRLLPRFVRARDGVEAGWVSEPPPAGEAFRLAGELEESWRRDLEGVRADTRPPHVRRTWRKLEEEASRTSP